MKWITLLVIVAMAGCAMVEIKKPDGTNVFAAVAGSTDLTDLDYGRETTRVVDSNTTITENITLGIGAATSTPDGVGEVAGAAAVAGVGL